MSFIPYQSPKGTVDLIAADAAHREALETRLKKMREQTVRWVPVLQFIAAQRPEMHWCSYDDGRVVAFVTLASDESFADLEPLYEAASKHTRHLEAVGYQGPFQSEPSPEDNVDIGWRKWSFRAGHTALQINCSFHMSRSCRVVSDGTETQTIEKRRVVCEEPVFRGEAA